MYQLAIEPKWMTCGTKREERKTRKKGLDELLAPKRGISFPDLIFLWIFFQAGDLRSWPGSGGFSFDGITWITCNVSILPCHRVMNSSDWRQTLSDNVMKTCLPIQVQLRFPPFPPAWSLEHFATADPRSWRQPCCNLSDWQIGMFVICQGACCELLDHV